MDLVIDLLYKIVPEIMLSIIAGHVLRRNKEAYLITYEGPHF